jgi:hypothetical protein
MEAAMRIAVGRRVKSTEHLDLATMRAIAIDYIVGTEVVVSMVESLGT